MSGTAATVDRACDACLRRAWLLAALVAHFERCSPRRSDLSGLLALPDGDLIRAIGGRDVAVLRDRYRGFSPSTLRSALAAFALHVVCRHDPAYPPQLAEAPTGRPRCSSPAPGSGSRRSWRRRRLRSSALAEPRATASRRGGCSGASSRRRG